MTTIPVETLAVIMKNMDYKSNIQFIRSCKAFHSFYAEKNNVLFTDHYLHPTDYMNAMIYFSRRNDIEKVKLLIKYEGEINQNNREDIVCFLGCTQKTIYEDAIVVYSRKYDKDSILDVRRLIRERPVLELVLKQGYRNFNYCDEEGDTPLHRVVDVSDIDACKTLLSLGDVVDPNIQNKKGNIPLHYATIPCFLVPHRYKIVRLLLDDARVDPNLKNNDGYAPLHTVIDLFSHVNNQGNEALTWLLADSRVDPNIQSNEGDTLLHIVANCICITTADTRIKMLNHVLSDPRVDPNVKNNRGNTSLYSSVILSNVQVFKCLLADLRVDCNSTNNNGETVYDLAYSSEIRQLLAPRVSFFNRHKEIIKPVVYAAPFAIIAGASIGLAIGEGFFPGCTAKGLYKVANMLGY
jgi:ankyrin repeat protein